MAEGGSLQSLQHALRDLARAYKNFFQQRAAFPRFKKRGQSDAFRYPQGVKLDQTNIPFASEVAFGCQGDRPMSVDHTMRRELAANNAAASKAKGIQRKKTGNHKASVTSNVKLTH